MRSTCDDMDPVEIQIKDSVLEPGLIQAFLTTDYLVDCEPPLTLQIGQHCAGLLSLYQRHACTSAAFLTAWNPYSKKLAAQDNERQNNQLEATLHDHQLVYLPGLGKGRGEPWGEASFLVPGMGLELACSIGRRYEQNAIVWCGEDAIPQLVLLR